MKTKMIGRISWRKVTITTTLLLLILCPAVQAPPVPPEGETITVDRRVVPPGGRSGGTRTLGAEGIDP